MRVGLSASSRSSPNRHMNAAGALSVRATGEARSHREKRTRHHVPEASQMRPVRGKCSCILWMSLVSCLSLCVCVCVYPPPLLVTEPALSRDAPLSQTTLTRKGGKKRKGTRMDTATAGEERTVGVLGAAAYPRGRSALPAAPSRHSFWRSATASSTTKTPSRTKRMVSSHRSIAPAGASSRFDIHFVST